MGRPQGAGERCQGGKTLPKRHWKRVGLAIPQHFQAVQQGRHREVRQRPAKPIERRSGQGDDQREHH